MPSAPTYQATAETVDQIGATATLNLPASISAGDILLCHLIRWNTGAASASGPTFPAGWTKLESEEVLSGFYKQTVAYRIADGTEGATFNVTYTGATAATERTSSEITRYNGASGISFVSSGNSTGGTTAWSTSARTSTGIYDLIVAFSGNWCTASALSALTPSTGGVTERYDKGVALSVNTVNFAMEELAAPILGGSYSMAGTYATAPATAWRCCAVLLHGYSAEGRVSQIAAEALITAPANALVSQIAVEVLYAPFVAKPSFNVILL